MILFHPRAVRCDSCALDGNAVLLCRLRSLERYLITGSVTVFQSQVIINCLQVDKRKQQIIFNHFPDDSGHFIAVHLDKRRGHSDLFHGVIPLVFVKIIKAVPDHIIISIAHVLCGKSFGLLRIFCLDGFHNRAVLRV